jgi:transposase
MMGTKERQFAPLDQVTLEELVPANHFYRQVERTLDLSFVRDLVAPFYATGGRPSIDPVVFFKLQLVMFFEDIRSERLLMRQVADRLGARWYVGYDLGEPLPDHSSLTRIRTRYGLETFRRFFAAIVEQCQAAGLVWGEELYIDATKVVANASVDSVQPRFAVAARAHLDDLFATDAGVEGPPPAPCDEAGEEPVRIGPADAAAPDLAAANAARHDWIAAGGCQDRTPQEDRRYARSSDFIVSTTDPDATHLRQRDGVRLGYQDTYLVDGGKARIILAVLVAAAEVPEDRPALDLVWHARFRWQLWPQQVTGDKAYGTLDLIRALEEQPIHAYMPLPDMSQRTPFFPKTDFVYLADQDVYTCPQGTRLSFARLMKAQRLRVYRADAATCNACPLRDRCTASSRGRTVVRNYDEDYMDRVRSYADRAAYHKALRKRSVWVEPLFGEAKDWHGLRRFRLRRLWRVNIEALLIAAGQNLKRLLSWRGWGRRPWPDGAAGVALAAPCPLFQPIFLLVGLFCPSWTSFSPSWPQTWETRSGEHLTVSHATGLRPPHSSTA